MSQSEVATTYTPSPAEVKFEADSQHNFAERTAEVIKAALSDGYGFAFATLELPDDLYALMGLTRETIHVKGTRPGYDENGARYWNLSTRRFPVPGMREFADQQADLASNAIGHRFVARRAVLNELDPSAEGELHEDDWLSIVFMKGSAKVIHGDGRKEPGVCYEANIVNSGMAAFCGIGMLKKVYPKAVFPNHRVDNPSDTTTRSSLAIQLDNRPVRSLMKTIVREVGGMIAEEL